MAPLAVTMGEPAGIGPDLILMLHSRREELALPPFVVFGNRPFLEQRAKRLGLAVQFAEEGSGTCEALEVVSIDGDVLDRPGEPYGPAGRVVIDAIAKAVAAVRAGTYRGVVTAPIHKGALYETGFAYPGHTEYLAALCAEKGIAPLPVMMLAHEDLRTVPLTIHVPIKDVPALLSRDLIIKTLRVMANDLQQRFGIATPRIAVAGLNPHAGEGGAIGREEIEIIAPAIAAAQAAGIDAVGPLPGDTVFYPPHWRQYDAVLAMYHDQALIPIKTVAFDAGVNVTLGLPIVRTSPDHGTASSLAGTGAASPSSMIAALRMADQMTRGQA